MKISENGLDLIKAFESCLEPIKSRPGYFRSYIDPVGVRTIGWGHTNHHPPPIGPSTVWSQAQCDEALDFDMDIFEGLVDRVAGVPLKQHQFDALVSWAYNTGGAPPRAGFAGATLWKRLWAKRSDLVPRELNKWTRGGGRVLSGLVRRRSSEALMFVGRIDDALVVARQGAGWRDLMREGIRL